MSLSLLEKYKVAEVFPGIDGAAWSTTTYGMAGVELSTRLGPYRITLAEWGARDATVSLVIPTDLDPIVILESKIDSKDDQQRVEVISSSLKRIGRILFEDANRILVALPRLVATRPFPV